MLYDPDWQPELPADWPDQLAALLGEPAPRELPLAGNRSSAVLIAFLCHPLEPSLLLVRKSERLNNHAGQVGFPGGGSDPADADLAATALREAWEEVGLEPTRVRVVGQLDDERTYVTGYHIRPMVAVVGQPPSVWRADPTEIADVIELPLRELLNAQPVSWLEFAQAGQTYRIPRYEWANGLVVWGATARLLWNLQRRLQRWCRAPVALVEHDGP